MDKIDKLKSMLKLLQEDTITPAQVKQFLEMVLDFIKKSKDSFETLSAENLAIIKDSIAFIEENSKKWDNTLSSKINLATGQMEGKMSECKALLAKIKTFKDGKDGIDGLLGEKGEPGLPGQNGSPDKRLQIVEKINTGKKDDLKIELKQLESFDKVHTKLSDNIINRAIGIVDQRTSFLINKVSNIRSDVDILQNRDTLDLSTYVPYTGATGNVDLGALGLFANTVRSTNVFENYNSGGIDLYSDAGVTQLGTLWSDTVDTIKYQGAVSGIAGVLDFAGLTTSDKTFTFPDASGTIALTSDLTSYLPLAGGTMTGGLNIGSTSAGANLNVYATEGAEMAPALEAANWTLTGGASASGGVLTFTSAGTAYPSGVFTVTAGRIYKVVITVTASANYTYYTLGNTAGQEPFSTTTYTQYITATGTDAISIVAVSGGTTTITSISIKELTPGTGDFINYGKLKVVNGLYDLNGNKQIDINSAGNVGIGASASNAGYKVVIGGGALNVGEYGVYARFFGKHPFFMYLDGANSIADFRSETAGDNPVTIRAYSAYTDASNYERMSLTGVAGASVNLTAETAGTGGDNLDIILTPAGTGKVKSATVFMPVQAATAAAPTYIKGGMYFDTTLNKMRIGGATAWETVTSV